MDNFKPKLTFQINNSESLFNKLLEEYADFSKNHLNPRFAINCAINSWHLSDWTYQEFFKTDNRFQDTITIAKGVEKKIYGLQLYQQHLNKLCPELEYMRLITNGIKHCILSDKSRTEDTIIQDGDFHPDDFSSEDFNVPRFVITTSKGNVDFEDILVVTIDFWKNYIVKL